MAEVDLSGHERDTGKVGNCLWLAWPALRKPNTVPVKAVGSLRGRKRPQQSCLVSRWSSENPQRRFLRSIKRDAPEEYPRLGSGTKPSILARGARDSRPQPRGRY